MPSLRPRLADAIRRRHDALRQTAGLNDEVFDALLLMAAGSWEHAALREGHRRVMQLTRDMDEGRRKRLMRLGFTEAEAGRSVGASHAQLHVAGLMPRSIVQLVVKIGGGLLAHAAHLDAALACVAAAAVDRRLLVVPGGGPFTEAVRNVDRQIGLSDDTAHWMAVLGDGSERASAGEPAAARR